MSADSTQGEIQSLYIDHHHWLRSWLRKSLGCSETAADLAQDTFIRVLLRQRQGVSIREPRAYLTKVARSLAINHWRRRDLEQAYLQALAALPEPEVSSPEQLELILETLLEIDRALDRLRPAIKRAFLLAQLEGMKYREIAVQLGVSEVTVKRYVKQALVHCLMTLE